MKESNNNIILSESEEKIVENSSLRVLQDMLRCIPVKCEWIIERIQKMISMKQSEIAIKSNINSRVSNILELEK